MSRTHVGDLMRQGYQAVATTFGLRLDARMIEIAEGWRPYRMWAVVLLRVGWTRARGPATSYRRSG